MRAPHSYCVAVRKADGGIVTEESPLPRVSEKYPIFKLPILRGLGTLGHAMYLGVRALRFSANASLADLAKPEEKPLQLSGWILGVNLAFSFVTFVAMYKFLPLLLATKLGAMFPTVAPAPGSEPDGRLHPAGVAAGFPVRHLAHEGHAADVPVSRRRAQGGVQFRIRQAGDGGERAEVRDLPSALRDQLSAGGNADRDPGLRVPAVRQLLHQAGGAHRAACRWCWA